LIFHEREEEPDVREENTHVHWLIGRVVRWGNVAQEERQEKDKNDAVEVKSVTISQIQFPEKSPMIALVMSGDKAFFCTLARSHREWKWLEFGIRFWDLMDW
jgi:hypothetical protein